MDAALEASTMRKVYIRLLPFAILSYVLAYIDRINVSFAALTMRDDLHMSAGDFGFAVGTFYWAYFLFEVPSNVIMEKVGARLWIARIMITWGIFAGATAFVTGTTSFGIVRFLLGMAEAGFFPGLILYFTYWFPARHHARIVSELPGRPADRGGVRCADLDGADGPGRPVRPARLADHVSRRGHPDDHHRHRHLLRADRQARAGQVPDAAGARLAGRARSPASARPRRRCGSIRCSNR